MNKTMVTNLFVGVLGAILGVGAWNWLAGDLVAKEREAHRDVVKTQAQLIAEQNIELEKLEEEKVKSQGLLLLCKGVLEAARDEMSAQRAARKKAEKKAARLWLLLKQERKAHYEKSQRLVEHKLLNEKIYKAFLEQVEPQDK